MRQDKAIPFIGPSYQSRSLNVDAQRSVNFYPEKVESGDGKNDFCLIGTPGLKVFVTLPSYPLRGQYVSQDRFFVVAGDTLYEVFSNATYKALGKLFTSRNYVGMADNGTQLCVVDGPNEYILTLATNIWLQNPAGANFFGSNTVTYLDGYFVFVKQNSNEIQLSALGDGTSMNDLDVAEKEGASDNIVTTINSHRQLYIFGTASTEVWYDQGGADFPLAPIQGVFIQTGVAGAFTVLELDNTIYWVGRDPRGQGIVYRMEGFQPVRISTHAIELLIKKMGDLSSMIAYSYQEEGHSFYVLNSPNASTTPVFDTATGLWHERQYCIPESGQYTRHRANFHSAIFNMHILGDWQNGNLYISDLDIYSDFGNPLHGIRISPHTSNNLNRLFFDFFQLDMETGVGLDGDVTGLTFGQALPPDNNIELESDFGEIELEDGRGGIELESGTTSYLGPQVLLRYSDDGGHTWSNEIPANIGSIGEYSTRVIWNRLGMSRDRVWEVKITDPVKRVLIDAKIGVTAGRN